MKIQLDEQLFYDLCKIHLWNLADPEADRRIRDGLQAKMDALMRRHLYSAYKTAGTPAEREQARQEYLDSIGVPDAFRWSDPDPQE